MFVSALTDGFPMLIDFVQDFTAFCGNKNQIFNPDAEFAGKIDAGSMEKVIPSCTTAVLERLTSPGS